MKKNFKRVLGLFLPAMILFWITAPSINALTIDLRLSEPAIFSGSDFTMDVFVQNFESFYEILSFGFDVDQGAFGYTGAEVNTGSFSDISSISTDTDVTDIAGYVFPGIPVDQTTDPILLASLNFTATGLSEGSYTLGITSDFSNPNEGLSTYSQDLVGAVFDLTENIEVNVRAAPVPEPGTIILMLMGLGGLGIVKRKRS